MRVCLGFISLVLGLFVGLLLSAAAAEGQQLTVRVVDPTGISIPDATVTVASRGQSVKTGVEGQAQLMLPSGSYTLSVRHPDFDSFQQPIQMGSSAKTITVQLQIRSVAQEVTVEASVDQVTLDPTENQDTLRIDQEMLTGLPVLDNDIVSAAAAFLDPGAGEGEGGLIVDGMEADSLGLSPAAIEEIKVDNNPYSALFSRPGRGRIEIRTKRATQEYHGQLNFSLRNAKFDARNAFAETRPDNSRRRFEGILLGPLGKSGKTGFLVNIEHHRDDQFSIVYAITPNGILQDQLSRPRRDSEYNFQIQHKPSDMSTFTLRYSYEVESAENNGVGGYDLPSLAFDDEESEHAVRAGWTTYRPTWVNDFQVNVERDKSDTVSVTPGQLRVDVDEAFTTGSAQADQSSVDYGLRAQNILKVNRGNWLIQGGASIRDLSYRKYTDRRNRIGGFSFASLADYESNLPAAFRQQSGEGRVDLWRGIWATFLQADWKARSNLTLGFGLRYEQESTVEDGNNLGPRLSIAWSPASKTVIRAGAGMFYDSIGLGVYRDTLFYDGINLRQSLVVGPQCQSFSTLEQCAASVGGQGRIPPNVVLMPGNLVTPTIYHFSAGVEQALPGRTTLSVNYRGYRGLHLLRSRDLNPISLITGERPDPTLGLVRSIESPASSRQHQMSVVMRTNRGRMFNGYVRYSLGRTWTNTDGEDWLPPNPADTTLDWSRTGWDRLHRFRAMGTTGIMKYFDLGLIFDASSGSPYNVTLGEDINGDGFLTDRPAGVQRNSLQGPGRVELDVRLSRSFQLGDSPRRKLQFQADAFNVFNRVNLGRPIGNLRSPLYGQSVSARSARRLQLGVRFSF